MIKKIYNEYKDVIILTIISLFIGILVGIIDTIFGRVLLKITDFRSKNVLFLLPFLAPAGLLIIYTYNKIGKDSLKGMSLIFQAGHNELDKIPKRLVPLIILSTWITHLFGGSAGREGVAVQIGGAVSHTIGRKINIKNSKKILLLTGMAAGFGGLFQTPIAALFFALEILTVGTIEYAALLPALTASFTASFTSHTLGLEKFSVVLTDNINIDPYIIIKLIIIGIIFGIIGRLFAILLSYCKSKFSEIFKNPLIKIFVIGLFLSVVLFLLHSGRYCGLGTNLISSSFNNDKIYVYDWIFKFALTIITLSAGFQGGEVTPLFSIGASLGVILASIFNLPVMLIAALGYTAVFGSATNTLLAPIFIGAEVFGYDYIPLFVVVCSIAYIFNGNKSIYGGQKLSI